MSLKTISDEEIVARLCDLSTAEETYSPVEQQYMEELYSRYYKQAYNLSRYYGLKHNDAEDAVQEVFVKLFTSTKTFHGGKKFKPWFFKMVLNKTRDKFRYLNRLAYRDIETMTDLADDKKNIFENFQIREGLNRIINRIPEKFRNILVLDAFGRLDYKEIAKMEGISSREVYYRLDRAYDLLKKEAEGDYESLT